MSTSDKDIEALELALARADYFGSLFSSASYGLYLAFSGMTLYLLLGNGPTYVARRWTIAYMAVMFAVTTAWYMTTARISAFAFVDEADAPKGVVLASKICAALQFLLSDSVLLFRVYLSWNRNLLVIVIPALVHLVCTVSSIISQVWVVSPWAEAHRVTLCMIFLGTTVSLNSLASLAIVYKVLLVMRNSSRSGYGAQGAELRAKASFVTIVESGIIYSVVGIVYLAYLRSASPTANGLSMLFQILSFLNPAFMILRMTMGLSHEYCDRSPSSPTGLDNAKELPSLP